MTLLSKRIMISSLLVLMSNIIYPVEGTFIDEVLSFWEKIDLARAIRDQDRASWSAYLARETLQLYARAASINSTVIEPYTVTLIERLEDEVSDLFFDINRDEVGCMRVTLHEMLEILKIKSKGYSSH